MQPEEDLSRDPGWAILEVDPRSGEKLSQEEAAYRLNIRREAEQGLIGMDATYHSTKAAIHQPLIDEEGQVVGRHWQMDRANQVTLRIMLREGMGAEELQQAAVTIAGAAIDDMAGEVMRPLYAIANDAPNWRRADFTVSLSALLDRMGYSRDSRGVHRSKSRQRLSSTLLALHLTHIGVKQHARRRGGRSVGFIAPLLATVGYATHAGVEDLSPFEVFEQGLPETVALSIHPAWYEGVRRQDGRPGSELALVPRPQPRPPGTRSRGNARSPAADHLREYVLRCKGRLAGPGVVLERKALLEIATIRDSRASQANTTLQRALDLLRSEGVLVSYGPVPFPVTPDAQLTLRWAE